MGFPAEAEAGTIPALTGSVTAENTTGTLPVAFKAARVPAVPML